MTAYLYVSLKAPSTFPGSISRLTLLRMSLSCRFSIMRGATVAVVLLGLLAVVSAGVLLAMGRRILLSTARTSRAAKT
jgi:hypothetical protein